MTVKPDKWIRQQAVKNKMIDPFEESQVRQGVISFGPSSYGYDFRVADDFRILQSKGSAIIDPKNLDDSLFSHSRGNSCVIPANSYLLARTVEYFRIPRDILAICLGKSTYARCGIIVNITPLEPEWEGYITMAISNTSPQPVKIYAGEGIGQVIFLEASDICEISYADKKGKYQGQASITYPKID